jgi:hypothetical protein
MARLDEWGFSLSFKCLPSYSRHQLRRAADRFVGDAATAGVMREAEIRDRYLLLVKPKEAFDHSHNRPWFSGPT